MKNLASPAPHREGVGIQDMEKHVRDLGRTILTRGAAPGEGVHTGHGDLAEGGPVGRVLCDGLAEVVGLAGPIVDNELQVVRRDRRRNGRAQRLDLMG
jgi:hypothetical protein